jgi:sterol desaturase/sphingolipid hydroxylase (fatty acid hydroxylase superfamily)
MFFPSSPWAQAASVFIFSVLRYFFIAGIAFLIFYIFKKKEYFIHKIQQRWPANKDYQREIGYSLTSFLFFAVVPVVLSLSFVRPYTTIYKNFADHGIWYNFLVFPLMLIIHDCYFYWTHRLMHHPKLFRIFHVVHHKSTNPSPWASFSFNPAEAIVESAIIYVFAFTIPVHFYHLLGFLFFMTAYNVYGHLGYELYPPNFNRHSIGKWLNTSVNHNMHHQYFHGNYGLYFTFWDKLMGTVHPGYHENFDAVTNAGRKSSTSTSGMTAWHRTR